MNTRSYVQRHNSETSEGLTARVQPRPFSDPQFDQPQTSGHDLSGVDLFAHAPQRSPIQTKLTVGAPNSKYEQEADRVAEQVLSMPDSATQQAIQRAGMEEEEDLQMKPLAATTTPLVQLEAMPEEEEVQMKPSGSLIQREAMPEEEEVQTKPLNSSTVQREAISEEESF